MKMRIVFQHIPKCAGSSVHSALVEAYGRDSLFEERLNRIEIYDWPSIFKKTCFSGHYDAWRVGLIPGPKYTFTFLRNPKSRIISLYRFWRSHKWSTIKKYKMKGPELAKANSFEDFLQIKHQGVVSTNIDNYYTRMVLGRIEDPSIAQLIRDNPEYATKRALAYYSSLDFVGIFERFDKDWPILAKELNICETPPSTENVTDQLHPEREKTEKLVITSKSSELLESLTKLDNEVYSAFATLPNA